MRIRIDPRWVRLAFLSALVAAVSCLAGRAIMVAPINIPIPGRDWIGAVVAMCTGVAGFAWLIVKAFDMFDVEGLRNGRDAK